MCKVAYRGKFDGPKPVNGPERTNRASGGSAKKGTTVNIIIAQKPEKPPMAPPGMGAPPPGMPPHPMPVPNGPPGGAPPGMAPPGAPSDGWVLICLPLRWAGLVGVRFILRWTMPQVVVREG